MTTVTFTTLETLSQCAKTVLTSLQPSGRATVLALHGDLGVGKTAFTKEMATLLNIPDEVTSPTFTIMKTYAIPAQSSFKRLVHIDAYRIEDEDEMRVLGFNTLLTSPDTLVMIEWPERIQNLIPEDAHHLIFTLTGQVRTIEYDI